MLNFRIELIKDLLAQGHQVYCFTANFSEENKEELAAIGAIALNYKLNSKGLNPIKDIKSTYLLKKQIAEISPDIVLSYFVKPVIFGSTAARFAKTPMIVGMLEGLGNAFIMPQTGQNLKKKLIRKIQIYLYKAVLPKLDTLILLNNDDKKELLEQYNIPTKRCVVLGGIGVDLKKFAYSPPPTTPISFIFIARLLREKGVFEYLQAAKLVKEKYPETKFMILGGFDKENPFALKQNDLSLYLDSETVIYPGHVTDVIAWLRNASVFVLPSYREGMPRSTQEAMAIGRAIITTDVPGCRETVDDGVNGFLIPPFSAELLAEKMCYFIEHPEKIEEMGMESRKIAEERFDVKRINQKIYKILEL